MINVRFKFKLGAGAIIAFFLVTVIFSTLVGVVFISINQSPSKRPEASGVPGGGSPPPSYVIPDAPGELTCNGQWKTVRDLGISSPEAIAGFSGKLVLVDESPPSQSPVAQRLAAREFGINDANGVITTDTNWYDTKFENTQASMVLIASPAGQEIYLYGDVNASRKVYRGRWDSQMNWVDFENTNADSLGRTGPKTARVGNHMYRSFFTWNSLSQTPKSYLQQCMYGTIALFNRCDVNRDTVLSSGDQELIAQRVTSYSTSPNFDPKFDLNGDKAINSGDQAIMANGILKYPTPTKFCY